MCVWCVCVHCEQSVGRKAGLVFACARGQQTFFPLESTKRSHVLTRPAKGRIWSAMFTIRECVIFSKGASKKLKGSAFSLLIDTIVWIVRCEEAVYSRITI